MIPFFSVECANGKKMPLVQTMLCIQKPEQSVEIPDLKFASGSKAIASLGRSGNLWPDCLGSDKSHFPILFSDSIITSLDQAGIIGLKFAEVEIDSSKNSHLKQHLSDIIYYQVSPLGKPLKFIFRVFEWVGDKFEYRFETQDKSDTRLRPMSLPYIRQVQKIPIIESWDGTDFIMINEKFSVHGSGGFYCSRRFVELAKQKQWSNLNFTPIDMIGMCGGDFRDRAWPPECWYPKNHPASVFA